MGSRSDVMYNREYESMLDGLEGYNYHVKEKKLRLSVDQVKGLERNFEVENKLESERKVKLAKELGLKPRQVAVWFQNRRARWKTKQLERDYGVLMANFDSLHKNYESLKLDKHALLIEIKELRLKVKEEKKMAIKEEETTSEAVKLGFGKMNKSESESDSDSSAILNASNTTTSSRFILKSSTLSLSSLQDSVYKPQFVKLEEHEVNLVFAEEEAPFLPWYCS